MKLYYKLVGHKNRYNYWSLGKFGTWLREGDGVDPMPGFATMEEWDEYHKLVDDLFWYKMSKRLDTIQDIVLFPVDWYRNIRCHLSNRFKYKLHCLETKLDKGQYYDLDVRLTHSIMNALIDFVDIEKSGNNFNSKKPEGSLRGLEYLDWEIGLTETSPVQAAGAKEIKELYFYCKQYLDEYEKYDMDTDYDSVSEILNRIINIRRQLWT